MSAVLANMLSGKGKPLMDTIRSEIKSFIRIEQGELTKYDTQLEADMRFLFIIIVTASLVMLLFALSFDFFLYREKQQQLENLVHLKTQHLLKIQEEMNNKLQQANVTLHISEEKFALRSNQSVMR